MAYSNEELGLEPIEVYFAALDTHQRGLGEARVQGSPTDIGRALLSIAWAHEKLGRGPEALKEAEEARGFLRRGEDIDLLAECCHSIGVWRFHNLADDSFGSEYFTEAIENRLQSGNVMGAAQSWHNKGFVELVNGFHSEANHSYERAGSLLNEVISAGSADARISAFKQMGFILSHQAFAWARQSLSSAALDTALSYFSHVNKTQAHREPVYVYLACGMALWQDNHSDPDVTEQARHLESMTGIAPSAEAWLRFAVSEASSAMTARHATGTGRRAYLGAQTLALSELARWAHAKGDSKMSHRLVMQGVELALARGWAGEARRVRETGLFGSH